MAFPFMRSYTIINPFDVPNLPFKFIPTFRGHYVDSFMIQTQLLVNRILRLFSNFLFPLSITTASAIFENGRSSSLTARVRDLTRLVF